MKRLFYVRNADGKAITRDAILGDRDKSPYYYDNKQDAKLCRNEVGPGATVGIGPDHWRAS